MQTEKMLDFMRSNVGKADVAAAASSTSDQIQVIQDANEAARVNNSLDRLASRLAASQKAA